MVIDLNKESYLAHIKDKNQILNMRKLMDKIEIVLNKHIVQATDFFDPYERRLAKSILNRFVEINYKEVGGLDRAERKIIIIYPEYIHIDDIESFINVLSIDFNNGSYSHRDILGAVLNLGIKRSKVGDILIHKESAQIVVKKEVSNYIIANLSKIGKQRIDVRSVPITSLKEGHTEFLIKYTTLSSLRLDVVIAGALNLSRKRSQQLIVAEKVKVNWEPIEKISKEIKEGDIISVRGFGRFVLNSVEGTSKKGRIKVELKLLI